MIGILASWLLISMLLAPVVGWVLRGISRDYPTPPPIPEQSVDELEEMWRA